MYGHSPPINVPSKISSTSEEDEDENATVDEASDDPYLQYDTHTLANGVGSVPNEDIVSPDSAYVYSDMVAQQFDETNQLSLSFRGQVYVYDDVTPNKVQAALLLLGGSEPSSNLQFRSVMDLPRPFSQPQRQASLSRFRQKREERCFDKKVRYAVRQEVALRMQRNKGKFTYIKKTDEANSPGISQESGEAENSPETLCTHCGKSSKTTPMMRRGPSGPRSLCNACGLSWANKGALRSLSKRSRDHSLTVAEQPQRGEGNNHNVSDIGTTIRTHSDLSSFSDGDNAVSMAENE